MTPMKPEEVYKLVDVINARQVEITGLEKKVRTVSNELVWKASLQGIDLCHLRSSWEGSWQAAFPETIKMNYSMAAKYMRLSENFDALKLEKCNSLSQCEKLIAAHRDAKRDHLPKLVKERWPAFLECLKAATTFINRLSTLPAKERPVEFMEQLRARLKPVVRELWPEAKIN